MADRIQNRRDTKARWAEVNPILLEGEIGMVLDDPNLYKVGDGVKRWNDLLFRGYNGTVVEIEGTASNVVMSQKGVTDALKKRDSNITDLQNDVNIQEFTEFINNVMILPDSEIVDSTYKSLKKIPIITGATIKKDAGSWASIIFYDSNGTVTRSFRDNWQDQVVAINECYVSCSLYKTSTTKVTIIKNPVTKVLNREVLSINTYINTINNDIKEINNKLPLGKHITTCNLNLNNDLELFKSLGGEVLSGKYGDIGCIYKLPIYTDGQYKIEFDVKFPKDLNKGELNRVTIANFGETLLNDHSVTGRWRLTVNKQKGGNVINSCQIFSRSNISLAASPLTVNNNYKVGYGPRANYDKPFLGDNCFSIRFCGDLSDVNNHDIVSTITDTHFIVKHKNTNSTLINIPFPANKNLESWLKDLLAIAGNLFEVDIYDLSKTTDDLLRYDECPMTITKAGVKTSYPTFIKYNTDDTWHKIEIVFDNSKQNVYGRMKLYIDGFDCGYFATNSSTMENLYYKENLILGADKDNNNANCEFRNLKIEHDKYYSSEPVIVCLVNHGLGGIFTQPEGSQQYASSYAAVANTIDLFKENNFKYATLQEVSDFMHGKIKLEGKFWTICHDDMFFFGFKGTEEEKKKAIRARTKYIQSGCIPACAIVGSPAYLTSLEQENDIKAHKNYFELVSHTYNHIDCSNVTFETLRNDFYNQLQVFSNKLEYFTTNLMYPGGKYCIDSAEWLYAHGITTAYNTEGHYGDWGTKYSPITRRRYPMNLWRFYSSELLSAMDSFVKPMIEYFKYK